MYKVFVTKVEWDLYDKYQREVTSRCESWGPYECTADEPLISFETSTEEDERFVKHVTVEDIDKDLWFSFELGFGACPPTIPRRR